MNRIALLFAVCLTACTPSSPTRMPLPTSVPPTLAPTSCPRGCEIRPLNCAIKGNIAVGSGEKIYHMPGQKYYDATVVNPRSGERWFCTEDEAISNGWRKSKE